MTSQNSCNEQLGKELLTWMKKVVERLQEKRISNQKNEFTSEEVIAELLEIDKYEPGTQMNSAKRFFGKAIAELARNSTTFELVSTEPSPARYRWK